MTHSNLRLYLTVALLAVVLGAAAAWWTLRPNAVAPDASQTFFAQRYIDAQGRQRAVSEWQGQTLIVNFWASWCAPCVEEMPDLQAIRDEYQAQNVEVLGIAIDTPANVAKFQERFNIRFPLLVAGAHGEALAAQLGNPTGQLPYTVLISSNGNVLHRKLGRIRPDELRHWLAK